MLKKFKVVFLSLTLGLAGTSTLGQANCGNTLEVVERLKTAYGETLFLQGFSSRKYLLSIYVSESGTWTALAQYPNGVSCIMDVGEYMERNTAPVGEKG